MLMGGAQLIIRRQDGPVVRCESFDHLAIQNPVLVTLAHSSTAKSQAQTSELYDGLVAELLAMGAERQLAPPCDARRAGSLTGCHAENEADCQKLLVMVTDGAHAVADQPGFQAWQAGNGSHAVLPVSPLAARTRFGLLFPSWVRPINAVFWTASLAEVVPAVFGSAGITAEQPQIFISYRQMESAALAIQLFDALGHAGFDVFLDHFRIPPGVNFQARLTEQLGDKSMVLFLESDTFLESDWVTYEVNVAKTCGLGLQALNLCQAPAIPGLDDGSRMKLGAPDFVGGSFGPTATLTIDKLQEVVALIRREHDRATVKRRRMLQASLEGAVLRAGGSPVPIGLGATQIDSADGQKRYVVTLTPKPPDLPDFHRVHGQAVKPTIGVVIGLSRLMESTRHRRLTWLAGVSTLTFRDEGDMLALAHEMVRGTL